MKFLKNWIGVFMLLCIVWILVYMCYSIFGLWSFHWIGVSLQWISIICGLGISIQLVIDCYDYYEEPEPVVRNLNNVLEIFDENEGDWGDWEEEEELEQ